MEFELTFDQMVEMLNQITNQPDLDSLEMHIEDALEEELELYKVDVLEHEIEPLYKALAGSRGLTGEVALLRAALS